MIALGYLREAKKGVSLGAHGLFLTRYIATDKLLDLLSGPHSIILPVLILPEKGNELIRVQQTIHIPPARVDGQWQPSGRCWHITRRGLNSVNRLGG